MDRNIQIISERLIMRPIQLADSDSIFLYRSNSVINQYQGWIPQTIDDVNDFILNLTSPQINQPGTWFQFVIIKKDENELIGDIGVHFHASDTSQVEIGCTLNHKHHGKSFAFEAVHSIINYLFDEWGKRRIIASIDSRNYPSIRLIERLGFQKKAHIKEIPAQNNECADDLIYALLKDEWSASKRT
ncbi:MAG: GNAT family N-acetyltransferase [Prolixibacteraceae bacterium]|nr:GNAT family N-acetyltransferase [Prolixibacteraceae bacterium]